jgi:hypothetical protein
MTGRGPGQLQHQAEHEVEQGRLGVKIKQALQEIGFKQSGVQVLHGKGQGRGDKRAALEIENKT